LTQQISDTSDNRKRIEILEKFMLSRIVKTGAEFDRRFSTSIKILSSCAGQMKIDKLAEDICLSKRQLERLFKNKIGLSPKEFSRILGFQYAIFIKQKNKDMALTSLALKAVYFDQSHFINDFKQISRYNPRKYFAFGEVVSDYYSF